MILLNTAPRISPANKTDEGGVLCFSFETRELMGIEKKAKIEFHIIDTFKQQERRVLPKVSILIVDSKVSLVEELKGSKNNHSNGALTLATYSNSDSTVLTYISIFETLWAPRLG